MAYQLIHTDEALTVENIVLLLFGDPGTGKSSLFFTAETPLCMDFDKGLQRAVGRKDSVRFSNWADALEFINSDELPKLGIKSLGIDTAGTMLDDYISGHILKMDVKGVDNGAGGLGLRGYGVMKDVAAKFFLRCKEHKIDVVFICHSKKEDDGDVKKFFPQMTGGSYDIIMGKTDLCGYMQMQGESITLDFNPTDRHTGKNCAGFKKMVLPHFTDPAYTDFLAKVIEATKNHMRKQNEAQLKALNLINEYKEKIISVDSIKALEELAPGFETLSPNYKAQVLQLYYKQYAELWALENINFEEMKTPEAFAKLTDQIKALPKNVGMELQESFKKLMNASGFTYDKATNTYIVKPKEPTATAPAVQNSTAPAPTQEAKPEPEKKEKAKKGKESIQLIIRDENWFTSRIGKKIIQRHPKGLDEITIKDEVDSYHLLEVMQKRKNFEFFDLGELEAASSPAAVQETATA